MAEKPILYYSNYCKYSQGVIDSLAHTQVKDDVHYMNIDNRFVGQNNKIFIRNNQHVIPLPENIDSVPSLWMDNTVLIGNEIRNFIFDRMKEHKGINDEIICYDFTNMTGVMSDNFSFLDQSAEEMAAKGDGGLRQLYNYATYDFMGKIDTPPDDFVPNKISGDVTLDKLIQQRQQEIKSVIPEPDIMARV